MWQTRKWVSVAIIATVLMIGAGMGWASLQDDPPPNTQSATATPTAPAPQTKENPPTATNGWPFAKRIDGIGATLVGISHDSHTLVFVGTHQVYGLDLTEPKGANSLSFHFRIQNPVSDAAVSPDGTIRRDRRGRSRRETARCRDRQGCRGLLAQRQTSRPSRCLQPGRHATNRTRDRL